MNEISRTQKGQRATLINKAMQHSYSNDDTCFRVDVIDNVTEKEVDALLDESKPFSTILEKISESSLNHELKEFLEIEIKEIPKQEEEGQNSKDSRRMSSWPYWGTLWSFHHFKEFFYAGFYWPTIFKKAHTLAQSCDTYQRSGSLSQRDEMPQNSI
nr:reverse transcriptase domain-containing protein [Tanacetum cinerariifolium]